MNTTGAYECALCGHREDSLDGSEFMPCGDPRRFLLPAAAPLPEPGPTFESEYGVNPHVFGERPHA